MADIQIPPAVGTSGQRLDAIVSNVASTIYRHIILVGDPNSSGPVASVTTSGGLMVAVSNPSAGSTSVSLSSAPLVIVASSGGTQLVAVTSGTITLSSTPLVVVATSGGTFLSALTSGTVTLSSTPLVQTASSSLIALTSAPLVIVATSGGTFLTALTSGTVTLSSTPLVQTASSSLFSLTSTPVVQTASSSLVSLTSTPVVQSASSGFVQISGTATVLNASSGVVQVLQSTQPWLFDLVSSGSAGGTKIQMFLNTSGGSTGVVGAASTSRVRLYGIRAWTSVLTSVSLNHLQIYDVSSSNATAGTTNPILTLPLAVYSTAAAAPSAPWTDWESDRGVNCAAGLSAFVSAVTATGSTQGSGRFSMEYSTG